MINKKFSLLLFLVFIVPLVSMEQPLPAKTVVTLISSDNKTFSLPLEVAQQSPVLSHMLTQFAEKETKTVNFSLIKSRYTQTRHKNNGVFL